MLTLTVSALRNALTPMVKLVRSASKPVLRTVLFAPSDRGVSLVATDLDCWIELSIPAEDTTPPFRVDAKSLEASLKGCASDTVTFERQASEVCMVAGDLTAMLPVLDADGPVPPETKWVHHATLNTTDLLNGLAKTIPFMARGPGRFALEGVHIAAKRGKPLALASSDTARLSVCRLQARTRRNGEAILPGDAAKRLQSMPAEGEVRIETSADEPQRLRFHATSGWVLTSRTHEGRFPRYESVIPTRAAGEMTLHPRPFLRELTRAGRLADPQTRSVAFRPDEDGRIRLDARNGSLASRHATHDRMPFWAADWKALAEALKLCRSETVRLQLTDGDSPLRLDEGDWTHVVMPIRVA